MAFYPTNKIDQWIYHNVNEYILLKSRIGNTAVMPEVAINQIVYILAVEIEKSREIHPRDYEVQIRGIFIDDAHSYALEVYVDIIVDNEVDPETYKLVEKVKAYIEENEFWICADVQHDILALAHTVIHIDIKKEYVMSDYYTKFHERFYEKAKKEIFWKE